LRAASRHGNPAIDVFRDGGGRVSEFGTPAFKEKWRKEGFFPAVDQIPPQAKGDTRGFRSLNARALRDFIARTRKDLARAEAALARLEQNIRPGDVGAKIDQTKLEQNIVALCGWVATVVAGMQASRTISPSPAS
jgi:hypothetical protein